MKRLAFLLILFVLMTSVLASCGGGNGGGETTAADIPGESTGKTDNGMEYEDESADESSGNGGEVDDTAPTKDPVITGDSDLEDANGTVTEEPTLPPSPEEPETSEWVTTEETEEETEEVRYD